MSEPREELARIARGVREHLERERGGGPELLALSAVKAQRARGGAPAPPAAAGPRVRAVAPPAPAPPADDERAEIEEALARASAPAPPPAESVDMFGNAPRKPLTYEPARPVAAAPLPPFTAPLHPLDPERRRVIAAEAAPVLAAIAEEVKQCRACVLGGLRTNAVPGVGTALSGIVFVGEGPGADEDRLGEPFVGKSGQLLDRIIEAINSRHLLPGLTLDRTTVYIGNIVKCRPPENRAPLPGEVAACTPFLKRQIAALKPRIICCLGKTAAEFLLGAKSTLGGMRGKVYRYEGAKLIVTYHPAAVLRTPSFKAPVWEDMQMLAREYQAD